MSDHQPYDLQFPPGFAPPALPEWPAVPQQVHAFAASPQPGYGGPMVQPGQATAQHMHMAPPMPRPLNAGVVAFLAIASGLILLGGLYLAIRVPPTLALTIVSGGAWTLAVAAVAVRLATRFPELKLPLAASIALPLLLVVALGGLFTEQSNRNVNDALPVIAEPADAMEGTAMEGKAMEGHAMEGGTVMAGGAMEAKGAAAKATLLSSGRFQSLAHPTRGTAKIVELTNGRKQLVLSGFKTDKGPDLYVYLSDGTEVGSDALRVARLKGVKGNQVYNLPVGADAEGFSNVVIWCRLASVSFGVAPLRAA